MRSASEPSVVATVPAGALDRLGTREGRLAFWINAYNALVVQGLVALGIRHSVWEVPDFFDRIGYRASDLFFSANDIEHGVLRGNRPSPLATAVPFPAGDPRLRYALAPVDPRVHFAISCGARSCPAVQTYTPHHLDAELDGSTRAFVTREVTLEDGVLTASPIFEWFRVDFDDWPGGLPGFLARYLDDGPVRRAVLERGLAGVVWRPYDWRLPAQRPPAEVVDGWTVPA